MKIIAVEFDVAQSRLLRWSPRSAKAIAWLFRETQEIDVYVEDQGSEYFYSSIIAQLGIPKNRVTRVVALNGRHHVLEEAKRYSSNRPAVFVIDGDLDWVRGDPAPNIPRLIRWDAYCVENLLLHKEAAERIVCEEGRVTLEKAAELLDFENWIAMPRKLLPKLFAVFALLSLSKTNVEPTVSAGVGKFLLDGKCDEVCPVKIDAKILELVDWLARQSSSRVVDARLADIERRVGCLLDPLDAVSGKDFVLPLFIFRVRERTKTRAPNKTLIHRLALNIEPERFKALKEALEKAA